MKKIMLLMGALLLALVVVAKPKTDAYLMVYFTDEDHSLHMAVSLDGYTFTAVNDNYAVLCGDSIAEQHGIRDPHILRAPDGTYLIALTDLHVFAREAGVRTQEWERPIEQYGWGNNKNLVLLRSKDLIHWDHNLLRINQIAGFEDIGCAWAPEMIWDEKQQAVMIYWTMRFANGNNKVYYAYLDPTYKHITTKPELIFEYPTNKSYIDADITYAPNGKYYMAYVSYDQGAGIKIADADNLTGPYTYREPYVDFERRACEAPNVWRRYGTNTFVLMYDCYGIVPPNFGFAETEDFKTFRDLGHFNEGVMKTTNFDKPKHGAVTYITKKQARKLLKYWQKHPDHSAKRVEVLKR